MKRRYAVELTEGMAVEGTFLLRSKELRLTRSGEGYLVMDLADRTGSISAVMFKPPRVACELPSDTVATIAGIVTTYRGERRISVRSMSPAASYDPKDLVPDGPRDRRELLKEFKALLASVQDPGLERLVRAVFEDRDFLARFLASPDSCHSHHPYLGGLLEHTVAVASSCAALADTHPADRDVLIVAAMLHDVGRVEEMEVDAGIQRTDRGRLLGHVSLGYSIVLDASHRVEGLRSELRYDVLHAVLAHHDREGGVRPLTLEALLLSGADRVDRDASRFLTATKGAARADERWTSSDGRVPTPHHPSASESA